MRFKNIIVTAFVTFAASVAMAEPTPKAVDLSKLHGRFAKAGYSSLDFMETTQRVLISGVGLELVESFDGNSILKVGVTANSPELAKLTAADDAQEKKLTTIQAGAKFKAVCDLAFTSGTQYMSFQECIFK